MGACSQCADTLLRAVSGASSGAGDGAPAGASLSQFVPTLGVCPDFESSHETEPTNDAGLKISSSLSFCAFGTGLRRKDCPDALAALCAVYFQQDQLTSECTASTYTRRQRERQGPVQAQFVVKRAAWRRSRSCAQCSSHLDVISAAAPLPFGRTCNLRQGMNAHAALCSKHTWRLRPVGEGMGRAPVWEPRLQKEAIGARIEHAAVDVAGRRRSQVRRHCRS